jgi:Ammonium Transporter Family
MCINSRFIAKIISCTSFNKIVILWNLLDSAGGGIAFWAVGYAFAYGGDSKEGGKTFIGTQGFFLQNDEIRFENWFFQFAFACALSCTFLYSIRIFMSSLAKRKITTTWWSGITHFC